METKEWTRGYDGVKATFQSFYQDNEQPNVRMTIGDELGETTLGNGYYNSRIGLFTINIRRIDALSESQLIDILSDTVSLVKGGADNANQQTL